MPKKQRLTVDKITSVGFVDAGANEESHILITKRNDTAQANSETPKEKDPMKKDAKDPVRKTDDPAATPAPATNPVETPATPATDPATDPVETPATPATDPVETPAPAGDDTADVDGVEKSAEALAKSNAVLKNQVDTLTKRLDEQDSEALLKAKTDLAGDIASHIDDPAKLGAFLKRASEKLEADDVTYLEGILKTANVRVEKSGLFKSVGHGGEDVLDPEQQIEKDAIAKAEKDGITKEQAVVALMESNPDLYDQAIDSE